ncbi:GTP cyclohydrolase I [Naviculisporaceae sp. PSN 640]
MPANDDKENDWSTLTKASNVLDGNRGDPNQGNGEKPNNRQSVVNNDTSCSQETLDTGTGSSPQKNPITTTAGGPLEDIKKAVHTILKSIGEDPTRPGLINTPKRFAEAMMVFTEGYSQSISEIVNGAIFDENHHEMVIVKDIDISSLCEHHLVPFTGKMHIGYIPDHKVIGLSKLPRIAEMFSRRLQVQERLTGQVADTIMEVLNPLGVAVMMESSHLCMVTRGVQKHMALTVTSCVRGCFKTDDKTRNEFFTLVGRG